MNKSKDITNYFNRKRWDSKGSTLVTAEEVKSASQASSPYKVASLKRVRRDLSRKSLEVFRVLRPTGSEKTTNLSPVTQEGAHWGTAAPVPTPITPSGRKPKRESTISHILGVIKRKRDNNAAQDVNDEDRDMETEDAKWGPVLDIPDDVLIQLALDLVGESSNSGTSVVKRLHGQNNAIFVVRYPDRSRICIRVPACGWGDKWTDSDANALRSQALTLQYISRHTKCPVPQCFTYDVTFDNAIGAPYLILSYVEGRSVADVWFEEPPTGSISLEEKRQNILRSLANASAELSPLVFDKMGSLQFATDNDQHPHVGASPLMNFGDSRTASLVQVVETLSTEPETNSRTWLRSLLENWKEAQINANNTGLLEDVYEIMGIYRLYTLILEEMPLTETNSIETFVLAPPDYDWQNILVDEGGNVTAILDWDRVETVPRYIGWARIPDFLFDDFANIYVWPHWSNRTMPPSQLERYRADYTYYMREACQGRGDCKYTAASHFYNLIVSTVNKIEADAEVLGKIMAIVLPRVDFKRLLPYLGEMGLRAAEEKEIRENARRLLNP